MTSSQEDNVKPAANQSSSSSRVSSLEEPLKFKYWEYKEKKELEDAGDTVGLEELKKKVRQRMEAELVSGNIFTRTWFNHYSKVK